MEQKYVQSKFPPEEKDDLVELARDYGVTRTTLLRALVQYAKKNKPTLELTTVVAPKAVAQVPLPA